GIGSDAEVDQDAEVGGVLPAGGQEMRQFLVEVFDVEVVKRAFAQVADGTHRGNHPVPARLAQQRHVMADPQILVIAAQVDDVGAFVAAHGFAQILHRGDDVVRRVIRTPVGGFFYD